MPRSVALEYSMHVSWGSSTDEDLRTVGLGRSGFYYPGSILTLITNAWFIGDSQEIEIKGKESLETMARGIILVQE